MWKGLSFPSLLFNSVFAVKVLYKPLKEVAKTNKDLTLISLRGCSSPHILSVALNESAYLPDWITCPEYPILCSKKNHFTNSSILTALYNKPRTFRTWYKCSLTDLKNMTIFSKYITENGHLTLDRMTSITRYNVLCLFFRLNRTCRILYSPWCEVNVFSLCSYRQF